MKMEAFASGLIFKKKLPLTGFKSSFKRTNLLVTKRRKRKESSWAKRKIHSNLTSLKKFNEF
jgi:hypothetical protein